MVSQARMLGLAGLNTGSNKQQHDPSRLTRLTPAPTPTPAAPAPTPTPTPAQQLERLKQEIFSSIREGQPKDVVKTSYWHDWEAAGGSKNQFDCVLLRAQLPVVLKQREVLQTIQENDVVLICGDTGCGKSTQVRLPLVPTQSLMMEFSRFRRCCWSRAIARRTSL